MTSRVRAALTFGAAVLAVGCADADSPHLVTAPDVARSVSANLHDDIADAPLGRVIVRFRGNSAVGRAVAQAARDRAADAFAARHGVKRERSMLLARAFVLETTTGQEQALVNTLLSDPEVEFAEVDALIPLQPCETGNCAENNDGFRGYKWDLHNTGSIINSTGTVLGMSGSVDADIDWREMYDALGASFSGSAIIGVIDSGILPTHTDLSGKVIASRNFATGYPDTFTQDRDSHGTHVAGIAAAKGNNGTGVMGVGFGVNITLVNAKACDRYVIQVDPVMVRTMCPTSSSTDAIIWATDQGANVLNLSLGSSATVTEGSASQQAALQYARSRGVLPFCASGNDGSTANISFPARLPECIAVGSTNWVDGRASYSNASPKVELSAPGGDGASLPLAYSLVLSTTPSSLNDPTQETNSSYSWKAGTSMATPQVAGLAAVLIATGVDASAVVARLKSTSDDLGVAGPDNLFGAGRINACRALNPAMLRIALPAAVNLTTTSSAIVPLTLFGSRRFTVDQFDLANLVLRAKGGAGVAVALRDGEFRASISDVDLDGFLDLSLKFSRDALIASGDLLQGSRSFALSGNIGCRRVEGSTTVIVRNK